MLVLYVNAIHRGISVLLWARRQLSVPHTRVINRRIQPRDAETGATHERDREIRAREGAFYGLVSL